MCQFDKGFYFAKLRNLSPLPGHEGAKQKCRRFQIKLNACYDGVPGLDRGSITAEHMGVS